MDIKSFSSLYGNNENHYQLEQNNLIKRNNLYRSLNNIKRILLRKDHQKLSPFNIKLALAEIYLKIGKYHEAEQIIKEASKTVNTLIVKVKKEDSPLYNKSYNKVDSNNSDIEKSLNDIKQNIKKEYLTKKLITDIDNKLSLAEAFTRNSNHSATKEVITEISEMLIKNNSSNQKK